MRCIVRIIKTSSIFTLLFIASCEQVMVDPEPVYEAAIRHYVKSWEQLPPVIVLTVEGENPSESLLKRLDDLDTELIAKDSGRTIRNSGTIGSMRDLSVRKLRRIGFKTFKIVISSQSETNGYVDAHGIEYYLEKKDGKWVVIKKGVEWMT